jgi:hypothetical protein
MLIVPGLGRTRPDWCEPDLIGPLGLIGPSATVQVNVAITGEALQRAALYLLYSEGNGPAGTAIAQA